MGNLYILAGALAADAYLRDPTMIWRKGGHPVEWMGWLVNQVDRWLNHPGAGRAHAIRSGGVAAACFVGVAIAAGSLLSWVFAVLGPIGWLLEAFVVFTLLAQRSLLDHVGEVGRALRLETSDAARKRVSRIVGRETASLDRTGIARAALESLAENFSDGIVAPAFWYAVFGLPGIVAYKMVNTADSMIGHRSERYLHFGRVAAQIDDLANWVPARFSALLIAMAALVRQGRRPAIDALATAFRDAGLHASPNAGWPEAALAGASGIALGGPRVYAGVSRPQPYLNGAGRMTIGSRDIEWAIGLVQIAGMILIVFVLAGAFLW